MVALHHRWFTDDLNKGHLEYIFFVLVALVILNWIWFLRVSRKFIYRETRLYGLVRDGEAGVEVNRASTDGHPSAAAVYAIDDEHHSLLEGSEGEEQVL